MNFLHYPLSSLQVLSLATVPTSTFFGIYVCVALGVLASATQANPVDAENSSGQW